MNSRTGNAGPRLAHLLSGAALVLATSTFACKSGDAADTSASGTNAENAPTTGAGSCGDKGLPDCPTQAWMKSNVQTYMRTKDFVRLDKALQTLAAAAPEDYEGWAEIANLGAQSAKAGDERGVKSQCSACHDKYRKRFKMERRSISLGL